MLKTAGNFVIKILKSKCQFSINSANKGHAVLRIAHHWGVCVVRPGRVGVGNAGGRILWVGFPVLMKCLGF